MNLYLNWVLQLQTVFQLQRRQNKKKEVFAVIAQSTCALPLFGFSEGLELTPDRIIGTEPAEEVGVVTTDVAVVSTTVEMDVVTTGQVTVGVVTTVLGNDAVATGATIPVAFATFTVAVGVVDEGVVEVLIPGVAGAAVTVIAGGEQAGSLALVWLGVVTVDAATLVLSTRTGEVVVAVVTPRETAH